MSRRSLQHGQLESPTAVAERPCQRPSPRAPSSASARAAVPLLLAMAGCARLCGDDGRMLEGQQALGELRSVAPRLEPRAEEPPEAPIRWAAAPKCELGYWFRIANELTPDPPSPTAVAGTLEMRGRFTASSPGEPRIELRSGAGWSGWLFRGVRLPGSEHDAGHWAPVLLDLAQDGGAVAEQDGPTALWSALGSLYGLELFYPPLPGDPAPGSESDWAFSATPRAASIQVEARRGGMPKALEKAAPPAVTPTPSSAKVRLLGWALIGGEPAAVLDARWESAERPSELPVTPESGSFVGLGTVASQTKEAFHGRWFVLASGRLLWARIESTGKKVTYQTPTERMTKTYGLSLSAEARLISNCAGPSMPAPDERPGDGELALREWAALVHDMTRGDPGAAAARFSPEVVAALGADKIADALVRLGLAHGHAALGSPSTLLSIDEEDGSQHFEMAGKSRSLSNPESVRARVEARVEKGVARFRTLRVAAEPGGTLLWISKDGIAEPAPAAPPPAAVQPDGSTSTNEPASAPEAPPPAAAPPQPSPGRDRP